MPNYDSNYSIKNISLHPWYGNEGTLMLYWCIALEQYILKFLTIKKGSLVILAQVWTKHREIFWHVKFFLCGTFFFQTFRQLKHLGRYSLVDWISLLKYLRKRSLISSLLGMTTFLSFGTVTVLVCWIVCCCRFKFKHINKNFFQIFVAF